MKKCETVLCKICNNKYKFINSFHLKIKHNLTIDEYKKLYPNAELISDLYKQRISTNFGDSKKNKKIISEKPKIILGEQVICLLCNEKMDMISTGHLKFKHNINLKEYIKRFPDAKISSENRSKKITNGQTGRVFTDEVKKKISDAHKGVKGSKKQIEGIRKYFDEGNGRENRRKQALKQKEKGIGIFTDESKIKSLEIKRNTIGNGYSKSGYREDLQMAFDSRPEANICRIFKFENIKFERPKLVHLIDDYGKQIRYIPDIYLPEFNLTIEVKPKTTGNTAGNLYKVKLFKKQIGNIIIIDKERYLDLVSRYANIINEWEFAQYENKCAKNYKEIKNIKEIINSWI